MSTEPCKNIWHRNPGGLVACPHCKMTLQELNASGVNGIPRAIAAAAPQRAMPDIRVQAKLFKGPLSQIEVIVEQANKWCLGISGDKRTEIVNNESHVADGQFILMIWTRMMY